jgi:hypothetical protein
MTANPKKAIALGLLVVVALYFWAPLVLGWFAKDEKPVTSPTAAKPPIPASTPAAPAASETVSAPAPLAKPKEPQPTWQQFIAWMDADPRTKPAAALAADCNPFHSPKAAVSAPRADVKPIAVEVTPQGANLVLSSTIVGDRVQAARINGKTYRPGDRLEVKLKSGQALEYTIAEIKARSVILTRSGKQYELKIENSKRSGTIEFAKIAP